MEYGMDSEMYTEQLNHVTDTLLRLGRLYLHLGLYLTAEAL